MQRPTLALIAIAAVAAVPSAPAPIQAQAQDEMSAYLMVYFKDETHDLHMALSSDGYSFTALNDGDAIVEGEEVALQKGIRDPHIARGPDGRFYLAMTDLHIFGDRAGYRDTRWERDGETYGWGNNRGFVLGTSDDLIHWSLTVLRVDRAFPGLEDVATAWAPETVYDPERETMMLYYTSRFGTGRDKLYYTYMNDDFTEMETYPEVLFEYPTDHNAIDGDITRVGEQYHLFYVAHDGTGGVKQAVSDRINGGYAYHPEWVDPEEVACEAPNLWKRIGEDTWVLMYDVFAGGVRNMGFSETSDFETFTDLGRFNEGVMTATNFTSPKHGAVIQLTAAEADRLANHWGLQTY